MWAAASLRQALQPWPGESATSIPLVAARRGGGMPSARASNAFGRAAFLIEPEKDRHFREQSAVRQASVERNTKETRIKAVLALDGTGQYRVATGIGFLDHMIEQLSRHSLIDIALEAEGDLHIDFHHTTEDCGIVLGQAVDQALGDRKGIERYGHAYIPMDETLSRVALDLSNRPYLVWKVEFSRPKLGEMDTELFKEFFQALAQAGGITLHIENIYGENNHHIVETCFKGVARALRQAIELDPRQKDSIPSTKGSL